MKKLNEKEALKLENIYFEAEIKKKEMQIQNLLLTIYDYKTKDLHRQIKDMSSETIQIKTHLKHLDEQIKLLKEKREQIVEPIKKRLKIKGAFGYDQDTLEVSTDNKEL